MTRADAIAILFPTTRDIEDGFTDLHKIATNSRGLVLVLEGHVVIMLPAEPAAYEVRR